MVAALENNLPDFFTKKGRRKQGIRPAAELVRQHRAPRARPPLRKPPMVARLARAGGGPEPLVRLASTDITVEEMDMTVEEFFRAQQAEAAAVDVALENDLPDFFIKKGRRKQGIRPAAELVRQHRAPLINKIEYWTGVRRGVVRALVDSIGETAERLGLWVETRLEPAVLVELTTYATTLAMNHLTRGSFVPPATRPPARPTTPPRAPGGADGGAGGAGRRRRGTPPAPGGARATRSSSSAWSRRASGAWRACAPTSS